MRNFPTIDTTVPHPSYSEMTTVYGTEAIDIARDVDCGLFVSVKGRPCRIMTPEKAMRAWSAGARVSLTIACSFGETSPRAA